jgi:hypothetical protein
MAVVQQYPRKTPKSNDSVIGTSVPDPNTNDDPKTVNFPISGIATLVAAQIPQGATGPAGAQGPAGTDGTSINILGTVANCSGLPTSGNTSGDLYILDADDAGCSYGAGTAGDGYVWTAENTWLNIGPLRGAQGIQGSTGPTGPTGPSGGVTSVQAGLNISVLPLPIGDVTVSAPNAVVNTTDTFGTPMVKNIVSLTQAEYNALVAAGTINVNTLYVII